MNPNDMMDYVLLICIAIGVMWVFWMPSVDAYDRRHRQRNIIFHINLWLGWTVIGWIVAYIWAQSADVELTKPDPS